MPSPACVVILAGRRVVVVSNFLPAAAAAIATTWQCMIYGCDEHCLPVSAGELSAVTDEEYFPSASGSLFVPLL